MESDSQLPTLTPKQLKLGRDWLHHLDDVIEQAAETHDKLKLAQANYPNTTVEQRWYEGGKTSIESFTHFADELKHYSLVVGLLGTGSKIFAIIEELARIKFVWEEFNATFEVRSNSTDVYVASRLASSAKKGMSRTLDILTRGLELLGESTANDDLKPTDIGRIQDISSIVSKDIQVLQITRDAVLMLEAASEARDSQEKAAGGEASGQLDSYFGSYADSESAHANRMRLATIIIVIAATVAVIVEPVLQSLGFISSTNYLSHALFVVPLLFLAAYSARESSKHRQASQWATQLQIKLRIIDAYATPLPQSEQDALRMAFGMYFFTEWSAQKEIEPNSFGAIGEFNRMIRGIGGVNDKNKTDSP